MSKLTPQSALLVIQYGLVLQYNRIDESSYHGVCQTSATTIQLRMCVLVTYFMVAHFS